MKVLLDVCTPVQVRKALPGHEVHTAVKMGWGQLQNGDLLRAAESAGFDLPDLDLERLQSLSVASCSRVCAFALFACFAGFS